MSTTTPDLWELVLGRTHIDPDDLAAAIERQAGQDDLDFRTRVLIRDGVNALERHWGSERLASWLASCSSRTKLQAVVRDDLGKVGFPSLTSRVIETIKPESVYQYLRELGADSKGPSRMVIGGSIALILAGLLERHTEDIDLVDEVPSEIRSQHDVLQRLSTRYGLGLTHFQSHYLPAGWEQRVRSLGTYGGLHVFLVDPYDIFVGKLFSRREKDLDDLRALANRLDRTELLNRLRTSSAALRGDAKLREAGERNWYVVFGEPLPS